MGTTCRLDHEGTHSYLLDGEPVDGVTTILCRALRGATDREWEALLQFRDLARWLGGRSESVKGVPLTVAAQAVAVAGEAVR